MKIDGLKERDSCLALVFLILLIWLFARANFLVYAAMAVLLLGMVWPAAMRPFAICWFGLARFTGGIMSSVLLTAVWLALVVPFGFVRKMLGKDSLHLKNFHGSGSAFIIRDHVYTAEDLKNPY